MKECSCGIKHKDLKRLKYLGKQSGFHWFNCSCKSTLVVKEDNTLVKLIRS